MSVLLATACDTGKPIPTIGIAAVASRTIYVLF